MLLQYRTFSEMLGFWSAGQFVLGPYSVGLIFLRQMTSRVCNPLPHDLEHVDQSVVCHLKAKILELLILPIKTQDRGARTSLSTSKAERLQVNLSQWIIDGNGKIYVFKISIFDRF